MPADAPFPPEWDARRVARVLESWPTFQPHAELREALLTRGRPGTFEAGDELIVQGKEDRDVYFLLRGEVDILVHGHLVGLRRAGQHVGEMAAIAASAQRSATVRARDRVFAWVLDGDAVAEIAATHSALWRIFASELADRLAQRGKVVEQRLPEAQGPLLSATTMPLVREVLTRLGTDARRRLYRGVEAPGVVLARDVAQDLVQLSGSGAPEGAPIALRALLRNALDLLSGPDAVVATEALRELELVLRARGAPSSVAGLERIIHRDDTLPFEFAEGMLGVSSAVAHLRCITDEGRVGGAGTGWLIAPRLLATAAHVAIVEDWGDVCFPSFEVRFDFHVDGVVPGAFCRCTEVVAYDHALDYAILRLPDDGPASPLRLAACPLKIPVAARFPVNVIQHPRDGAKRLGIRNNLVADRGEQRIRYFTDTDEGSSGAPVLDDRWRVVAIHTKWENNEPALVFQGERTAYVNVGTRIDRILEHLQARFPDVAAEVAASQAAHQAKAT